MTALDLAISAAEPAPAITPRRRFSIRRHVLLFAAIFALVAGPLFIAGALLKRTYHVSAHFELIDHAAADAAGADDDFGLTPASSAAATDLTQALARVPYAALSPQSVTVDATAVDAARTRVTLSSATEKRDAALAMMKAAIELYTRERAWRSEDDVTHARVRLARAASDAASTRKAADAALTPFAEGDLARTLTTASARIETLERTLADRTHALTVTLDTISRTEKQRGAGRRPAAATVAAAPVGVAASPDQDAEVVQLRAQLRMLAEQIEEQLGALGRTETHPYVADLRGKEELLRKKVDAAVKRAASGQAPPASALITPPRESGPTAADQAVELRLAQLYAERDALESEVAALKLQNAQAKKDAEALSPKQREFAAAKQKQAEAAAAADAAAARLARFDKRFATRGGQTPGRALEVTEPRFSGKDARPVWPTFPAIAGVSLLGGLLPALLAVGLADAARRGFTGPRDFAAAIPEVPLLGTVSEIRSAGQRRRRHMWRSIIRPALVAALVAAVVGAAAVSYYALGRQDAAAALSL